MSVGGGGSIVSPFSTWNVAAASIIGNVTNASLQVNSNGTITSSVSQSDNGTITGSNWYSVTTTGAGNNYWVRFTPTTGTLTTNTASTFTNMGSTQTAAVQLPSTSSKLCTFTIEIATDSGGSNIVLTSTGNIVQCTHT
jgi:hypothetical protein